MAGDRPLILIALSAFLFLFFITIIVLAVRLNNYECPEASEDDQANVSYVRNTGRPYYGKLVGNLPSYDHGLRGTVYVVDDKRLRIRHLYYDGRAPAAFFWVGVKGTSNDVVDISGVDIPNEHGTNALLLKYEDADITLTLPGNMTVYNLKWFSMWCKSVRMSFGHVFFVADYEDDQSNGRNIGRPYYGKLVGNLPSYDHGLQGTVYVVDDKHLRIRHLYYDGRAPAAFFWVGVNGTSNDDVDTSGVDIPNEHGTNALLLKYDDADITLTLPGSMTVYNLKWFSMWCKRVRMSFGHVFFSYDVPRPRVIGQFDNTAGVSSGPITVLDDRTVHIQAFTFNGLVSNAYFSAGNNEHQENISPFQLARLEGGFDVLTTVSGANVTLIFPIGLSVFEVDYLGVFYTDQTANKLPVKLNLVKIPPKLNVPANLKKFQT